MTRNVILDFDGTIGDTQKLIIRTLQETMRSMGLEVKTNSECAGTIGKRLDEGFAMLYGMTQEEADKCADTYRKIFMRNKEQIKVEPFPHVTDTIRQLHKDGVVVSIASSRSRASLIEYVEQLHLAPCISCIVAANDVKNVKPAPDMVLKVLEETGGKADESIVVGDMTYDIDMGHNAGTKACAVTYGNGTREQLAKADYIIDDFAQLTDIVKGNIQKAGR